MDHVIAVLQGSGGDTVDVSIPKDVCFIVAVERNVLIC